MKVERLYPLGDGDYEACGWKMYEKGSVLEGSTQECVVGIFTTLDEAIAKYPDAEIMDHGRCKEYRPTMALHPPSDFSYYDAGEYWSDDY